ncbi:FmdB family zinc ribbon protein [Desulfovibrio litoralis]|uniref:Putative regulatory protein, FmdB family n=1 Tax=Desulfovibrio litoralis DSM 11393 TaxID=1121455 RepID=A0A1M7T5M0_9BACT|nr:zinc ribbon domain-containing protein [Desulfovibrio litoralis]SHN66031.1 putative regulatory protein, FmdB family [Desulfovibrio litoralis DSM 11393]
MPIFEFRCEKCGNEFEELVFGNDLPPCPKCKHNVCQKLISMAQFNVPGPSRAGQTVTFPSSGGGSKCGGCSGGDCSSC